MEIVLKSLKDTEKLAKKIAKDLLKGGPSVLALYGNLGSGKTTFTQFLAKALGVKEKILSPTFVIIKTYKCDTNIRMHANDTNKVKNLVHIDTYRLKSSKDLVVLGLKDLLKNKENILVIEWPEKIEKYLPSDTIRLYFEVIGENTRKVVIKSNIKNQNAK